MDKDRNKLLAKGKKATSKRDEMKSYNTKKGHSISSLFVCMCVLTTKLFNSFSALFKKKKSYLQLEL